MSARRDSVICLVVLAGALMACKKSENKAASAASATAMPAAVEPTAAAPATAAATANSDSIKPDPAAAKMNKGKKPLKFGKLLGEASRDEFKKALKDDGWFVYSATTSKSSGARIMMISGRNEKSKLKAYVTVYEYTDPDYRAERFKSMKKRTDKLTYVDGDYAMQVDVEKDKTFDPAASKKLLATLVGS